MTQRYTGSSAPVTGGDWAWPACVWSGPASMPSLLLPGCLYSVRQDVAPAFARGG